MLTIFAVPKAFEGHTAVIQDNALESWRRLLPACEILLFGDDAGVADRAASVGARHLPSIKSTQRGTPLVGDVFEQAAQQARFDLLAYVNADIILTDAWLRAVERCRTASRGAFLMVGRRMDLDVNEPLPFEDGWERALEDRAAREGRLQAASGLDYFVYPRGLFDEVPPFAIGRTVWDNWLLHRAHERRAKVIDATPVVRVVHQNHDYGHIQGGGGKREAWRGAEAQENERLALQASPTFVRDQTTFDAHWRLTDEKVEPALQGAYLRRRLAQLGREVPATELVVRAVLKAGRVSRPWRERAGLVLGPTDE